MPQSVVVLVVEDQPLLRLAAVDMVDELGFTAVEAVTASDAVRILENRPDIRIVFTDINMPGDMDGMRLAAVIRDRWPPIELILTSAEVKPDLTALPVRALFFAKPYRPGEVAAAMLQFASAA